MFICVCDILLSGHLGSGQTNEITFICLKWQFYSTYSTCGLHSMHIMRNALSQNKKNLFALYFPFFLPSIALLFLPFFLSYYTIRCPFTSPLPSIYSRFANINLQREKNGISTPNITIELRTLDELLYSILFGLCVKARSSCSYEPNELGNECELNFIRHTQYVA